MKPGLKRFLLGSSWALMLLGVVSTLVMSLAIWHMPGAPAQRIASMLPAAVMLLTLSFGVGAVLRVLLSIDQKLEAKA